MHEQVVSYTHPQLLKTIGPSKSPPRPDHIRRPDGFQMVFRFRNGYGASVVCHKGSYGGDQGRYELAVVMWHSEKDNDWSITYSTPITNDVLGHLEQSDVLDVLNQVAALPPDAQVLAGAILD